MDITQFSQINPPQRLLMGPGPINADPRVLRAMSSQLVGQYDPAMTHYMNEVMALYRGVFRTEIAGRCWSTAPRAPGSKRFCCRRSVPVTRCWCRCSAGLVICCARSRVAAGRKCTPSRCRGARSLRRIRLRMRSSACGRACCSPCRAIPPPPCCSRWRSWGDLPSSRCAVLYRRHRVARR